jgi:hypothetical protein
MPKSKSQLDSAQVHSEWTVGMRTPQWGELWQRILFAVVDDLQIAKRARRAASVREAPPGEVTDGNGGS